MHPAPAVRGRHVAACACLLVPLGAAAADTSWIGSAAADPYWDLTAHWSAGPPLSTTTRALLGAFDTTLRSGSFLADTVQGSGTLTMTGGQLQLAGAGSSLGGLDLQGGTLAGSLTVQRLRWSGGGYESEESSSPPGTLTVTGPASIAGNVTGTTYSPLGSAAVRLLGATSWEAGPSTIATWDPLTIGPNGVFTDHATTANHEFGFNYGAGLFNQGRYEKLGAATTAMRQLGNEGVVNIRDGTLRIQGYGSGLENRGTINILGGRLEVDKGAAQSGFVSNYGSINVLGGAMSVHTLWNTTSTGAWTIGPQGSVTFNNGGVGQSGPAGVGFLDGLVRNDGLMQFSGSNTAAYVGASTSWTGDGRLEVLDGAILMLAGYAHVGELVIGPPVEHEFNGSRGPVWTQLTLTDVDLTLADHAEVIGTSGSVALEGALDVSFADLTPALGLYRLVTANGGFVAYDLQSFDTNLNDSLYRTELFNDGTHLDLRVAAVPEPASAVLCIAGLGLLAAGARRRSARRVTSAGARRRCRHPGSRS